MREGNRRTSRALLIVVLIGAGSCANREPRAGAGDVNEPHEASPTSPQPSTAMPGPSATSGGVAALPSPRESGSAAPAGSGSVAPATGPCAQPYHGDIHPDCLRAGAPDVAVCPASFDAAKKKGQCGVIGKTQPATCTFAEGTCTCAGTPYCGGPYPSPWQQYGMSWQCRNKPKPGECPLTFAHGGSCRVPGMKCSAGTCARATACVCRGGTWRCTTQHLPPQP